MVLFFRFVVGNLAHACAQYVYFQLQCEGLTDGFSVEFCPPEVLHGSAPFHCLPSIDVFSLAMTLVYALLPNVPKKEPTADYIDDCLSRIRKRGFVSESFIKLLSRMLEQDPAERPELKDVAMQLDQIDSDANFLDANFNTFANLDEMILFHVSSSDELLEKSVDLDRRKMAGQELGNSKIRN